MTTNLRIKNRLTILKMTLADLRKATGISVYKASRIINGHQQPTLSDMQRFALGLKCAAVDLWPECNVNFAAPSQEGQHDAPEHPDNAAVSTM